MNLAPMQIKKKSFGVKSLVKSVASKSHLVFILIPQRWQHSTWGNYSFKDNKWQNVNSPERRAYQIDAYRVLLTRARQGMVLCIPEGNPDDATRLPKFYNGTYEYLKKSVSQRFDFQTMA